jgi:lipopolysaccharide export system permease protein
MIIARYLIKEIAQTLFGVSLVLMIIGLSGQLVSVFSDVAAGILSVNTVLVVLGLKSLKMLLVILPLSLYLAVLMTLSRLYQSNEMAAISACGISQTQIMRIVLSFAFLFAIVVGIFSLQITPWANAVNQKFDADAKRSSEMEGLVAGRFRETSSGVGVSYIEAINEDRTEMDNVFIQKHVNKNGELVLRAKHAKRKTDKQTGDQFMVLTDGVRYESTHGQLDYSVIEFERHGIRIGEKAEKIPALKEISMPTLLLLDNKSVVSQAEVHARIAPIVLCLLFAALAVPLSQTSARQGRYLRLGFGLLIYIVFTNLISIGKTWIVSGKVSTVIGLWWVHALMLALVVFLVMQQLGFRYLFAKEHKA